jgi:hypothetical protein
MVERRRHVDNLLSKRSGLRELPPFRSKARRERAASRRNAGRIEELFGRFSITQTREPYHVDRLLGGRSS